MARACDDNTCTHLLVRGDRIEFISVEQARAVGCGPLVCPPKLNESAMPSDIRLPRDFVLVHDESGEVFPRCELWILRWRNSNGHASEVQGPAEATARAYFGRNNWRVGAVEIPQGPWEPLTKIRLVRYRRPGYDNGFEHLFQQDVMLYYSPRPLAWKLSLPNGCVVNSHGFVRP